jgi:catechol 2,3-dioxygenase-like lactoylglutathione lyase family enzyme
MTDKIKTIHVALQYSDRKKADIFFNKILGLSLEKTFSLSKDLSKDIFGVSEELIVDVYKNDEACFEVFITGIKTNNSFEHTCIEIENMAEFLRRCKEYGIEPIFVKKGVKTLLFIKDFSGNLFEIKKK